VPEPSDKVSNTVLTADGSVTLRDDHTGELYHHSGGALFEAIESYVLPSQLEDIIQRRKGVANSTVRTIDSCFGLGYNSFALWQHILNASHLPIDKIETTAIELDAELMKTLPVVLQQDCFKPLVNALRDQYGKTIVDNLRAFEQIGLTPASLQLSYQVHQGPQYVLNLHFSDLRKKIPELSASEAGTYDLIFHDPFSPAKMPQLWTADLFRHYYTLLREESGRLLTYSAASAIRGGLAEVGFEVYRTRPLGVKRGGTLASRGSKIELIDNLIYDLYEDEAERMRGSSGVPYRDPDLNSDNKEIYRRREAEQTEFKKRAAAQTGS
jgi:tRNA U34 5-methylaminomethyl-2-thiouridine-forming methyltransferase MnmC